ncbi:MAG: chitobiase/beta-hexosaminidase C-terminal domain-containing protein [Eubacteriales bacterium]|nr:chitobiase/beta-hexosaminidase C-terminal domain-containing protein [Eubacteriales bacterium]
MPKKLAFTALLCLCMALFLLPGAALAETATSVVVNGVTLDGTANIYATTNASGTVTAQPSYTENDAWNIKFQNGVLTLKNATIAGITRDYRGFGNENLAIYAAGDLRLVLEGANSVYSADSTEVSAGICIGYFAGPSGMNGNLTIEGSGSLHAYNLENGTSLQNGMNVYGVLTIKSGTITAEAKSTTNGHSYGVFATKGFVMTGGTLTAVGGDATGLRKASAGLTTTGDVTISGGTVIATSGKSTLTSFGLSAGSGKTTISASAGGAVKVTAKTTETTLQSRGAFNIQPTLSDGAVYTWRKDESATPTSSAVTPYTWSANDSFTELTLAQVCATPVIAPAAGSYLLPQSVTLTCATAGAVIRYTTDGTEPTETSAAYTTGNPIAITSATTVKAKAFHTSGSLSGTATAAYTITGSAPVIGTQPSNQTVAVGSPATFTVSATGNPAPSYQWQLSTDGGATWSDLTGSTSASYTVSATTIAMSGYQYRCAVSNSFLPVLNSRAAILTVSTVNPLPILTVIDGTGSGDYAAGTRVSIAANAPPAGQQFKAWVIMSGGGSIVASANATTEYVMPDNAATITATYEAVVVVPPQTGDNSKPLLWLGMCLLGGLGLVLTIRKKRRA